jgi:hypothetical protein
MQVDELVDALARHGDGVRVGGRHAVRIGRRRDTFTTLHVGGVRLSVLSGRQGRVRAVAVTAGGDPGLGAVLRGVADCVPVMRRLPHSTVTLMLGRPSYFDDDDDPDGVLAGQCETDEVAGIVSVYVGRGFLSQRKEARRFFLLGGEVGVEAILSAVATGEAKEALEIAGLHPGFGEALAVAKAEYGV